jgi:hypothetical protein
VADILNWKAPTESRNQELHWNGWILLAIH